MPVFAAAVLCMGIFHGCGGDDTVAPDALGGSPVVKTAEKGPIKMTVSVANGEISLADRIELNIEVVAQSAVEFEMPTFGDELQVFAVRDIRDSGDEPYEQGLRRRQTYILDPFVSGDYEIPALTVEFVDRRAGDDDVVESSLSTEPIPIKVTSLMEGDFDPTDFKDIKGLVDLPMATSTRWAWWIGGGVAVVAVISFVAFLILRRLRRPIPEIVVPAHEWAFDALQRLIEDRLVEQGDVSEFYFRLSMIVREYIERRFDLSASEWTTEEFLVNVQRGDSLPPEFRGMLGEFLQTCDLVKFALYQPATEEIEQAFNAAREFITRTAQYDLPGRAAA